MFDRAIRGGYTAGRWVTAISRTTSYCPRRSRPYAGQREDVTVSAGALLSIALTADGAVFSWGEGEDGCLGHRGEDLSKESQEG